MASTVVDNVPAKENKVVLLQRKPRDAETIAVQLYHSQRLHWLAGGWQVNG